jgi:hypothetical protein
MARRFTAPAFCLLAAALLAACGQAPQGSTASQEASSSLAARSASADTAVQSLITQYQALSWKTDADHKKVLLARIVATGSDSAAECLLQDYQGLSWSDDKDLKMLVLDAMDQLTAPSASASAAGSMSAQSIFRHLPSPKALWRIAEALERDRGKAPAEARPKVDRVLSHIMIVAPHTSR